MSIKTKLPHHTSASTKDEVERIINDQEYVGEKYLVEPPEIRRDGEVAESIVAKRPQ
jgi:hypothetical protein